MLVDNAKELFDHVYDIPESYYHMWLTVGKTYFENLLDYDVYAEISSYDKEVLIIHGNKDNIVPLSYSQKAVNVYPLAKLYVIEGAGHGFYDEAFEKTMQYISHYLIENTQKQ